MRILLCSTLCAAALAAQDPATRIAAICSGSGGLARVSKIGESVGGRSIDVVTISVDGPLGEADRPAILIVAGVHGEHVLGTELAIAHLSHFVDDARNGVEATRQLLTERVVYIVPTLSPDAFALGRSGNARALDLDRDGRRDEDAPRDLDGDGQITHMRWNDPDGEWLIDVDDPRLMRRADRENGERGTHSVALEAADTDADDERAEDPGQGVAIWRNFAHRHEEFDRSAGPFPMSEPESRALADFVFSHRNIIMAFVWDADDVLLATPESSTPGRRVQRDGIHEDDEGLFSKVGARYRERTGREGESSPRMDGSTWAWLYLQAGIPTFASDVWRVPTGHESDDKVTTDDAERIALCDRLGLGFVPWSTFAHPELGSIEIGGFVTSHDDQLCTEGERSTIFAAHHGFLLEIAAMGPRLRIREFDHEALGDGAYRLRAVIVNDGDWPTLCGMGDESRRFGGPRVRLETNGASIVAGDERTQLRSLDALGGKEELSWIVTGRPGTTLRVELVGDPVGHDSREVTL